MSFSLAVVMAAFALPLIVLVAWGMWLLFAAHVASRHGIDGLKAIRPFVDGFRPRDWARLIPGQGVQRTPGVPPEAREPGRVESSAPSGSHGESRSSIDSGTPADADPNAGVTETDHVDESA